MPAPRLRGDRLRGHDNEGVLRDGLRSGPESGHVCSATCNRVRGADPLRPQAPLRSAPMDFELHEQQQSIRDSLQKVCARFDDDYWRRFDEDHHYPVDYPEAPRASGWLGVPIPEETGGAALRPTH